MWTPGLGELPEVLVISFHPDKVQNMLHILVYQCHWHIFIDPSCADLADLYRDNFSTFCIH